MSDCNAKFLAKPIECLGDGGHAGDHYGEDDAGFTVRWAPQSSAGPVDAARVAALETQLAAAVARAEAKNTGYRADLATQSAARDLDVGALEADLARATEEESRAWAVLTGQAWTQTRPEGSLLAAAERVVADLALLAAQNVRAESRAEDAEFALASARQEAEGLRARLTALDKHTFDQDDDNAPLYVLRDEMLAALSSPAPVPATPVSAIHNVGKPCPVCSGCDVCLGTGRAPHYVPAPVPATPAPDEGSTR